MGDFVNQMVPIPMETVPPRPQRVSSSTGLRGLGTQGSAFESARRALQRQQCLFYASRCASPTGIKCARPARAAEGLQRDLPPISPGGGWKRGGHFCPLGRPALLLAPSLYPPPPSPFGGRWRPCTFPPQAELTAPHQAGADPPQGSRARGAEGRGPGDVGAKPSSTPVSLLRHWFLTRGDEAPVIP